jgi:hypothetical protein
MKLSRRIAIICMLALPAGAPAASGELARRVLDQDGWTSWRVPMVEGMGRPCCLDGHGNRARADGCSLDGRSWNIGRNDDDPRPAGADGLDVYVHVSGSRIDKARAFAATCPVRDTDRVRRLDGVSGGESVAFLAGAAANDALQDAADGEIEALALHADASATPALTRLAGSTQPRKLREQSLFWLGQARGAEGAKFVEQVATGSDDDELRSNAVFDLSQARAVDAYASIRHIAQVDRSTHVRGQALFWMAQMGDKRARDDILAALGRAQTSEIREQAVFALSQLESDEADAALILLVRGDYPREVKEKALFWLGQSGSEQAIAFLDEVLAGSGSRR